MTMANSVKVEKKIEDQWLYSVYKLPVHVISIKYFAPM